MALQSTTNPQKDYPLAGLSTFAQVNATPAWTNSAWGEVIAATPTAWVLTGVHVWSSPQLGDFAVEVGVGPDGAVVTIVTLMGFVFGGDWLQCPIPVDAIPMGSRVSIRHRTQNFFGGQTAFFQLTYYEKPLTGLVATTTIPTAIQPTSQNGTVVISGATPWVNGAWVTLIASTTGAWTIGAVQIVWDPDLSVSGAIWGELDIGVGTGPEVVVTTIRWSDTAFGNAGTRLFQVWPLLTGIAGGVRVSLRLRTNQSEAIFVFVKALYYVGLSGIGDISTTLPTVWVPSAANSIVLTKPSGAWAASPWVPFIASTAAPLAVTYVVVDESNANNEAEVDIGVNEVVKATLRWSTNVAGSNGVGRWYLMLPIALEVPVGSTLSLRTRNANASAISDRFVIGYIENPMFTQRVVENLRTYIAAADGPLLALPATPWTDSEWGELTPATESDILVTGVELGPNLSGPWRADLGVGPLGSVVVVTTVRGFVISGPLAWWPLPTPLYIPIGTRLSVRLRQNDASQFRRMGVTYYGFIPEPPQPPVSGCTVGVTTCAPQRGAPRIGV